MLGEKGESVNINPEQSINAALFPSTLTASYIMDGEAFSTLGEKITVATEWLRIT